MQVAVGDVAMYASAVRAPMAEGKTLLAQVAASDTPPPVCKVQGSGPSQA